MYFLGLDGGGTKTLVVLTDEKGTVCSARRFGPGNVAVVGVEKTLALIDEICHAILSERHEQTIRWATLGLAGAGRQSIRQALKAGLNRSRMDDATIFSDAELLYQSVFMDSDGILVIAGTGSIALARQDEAFQQVGGWGYLLGDEGSGYDIGRQAIRQALQEEENGQAYSGLTAAVLDFYAVETPKQLLEKVYAADNSQNIVAACAERVCAMAAAGENAAVRIAQAAAAALLDLAKRGFTTVRESPVELGLCGSVLGHGSPVRRYFEVLAEQEGLEFDYVEPRYHPAVAGVIHAMRQTDVPVSDDLITTLQTEVSKLERG